ncbi:uncharacterized protein BXZ73DRAFT_99102 [Epithele typhae]|uniref:uncharacterized protein n=1 Tax=Epithele typhae TaxID=378194 RepID=UPI002008C16D|nr:uncharacterized protein BXZ73DRAFT_99102 [Epithele typhae]KAH9940102.1 hypothetical protein BXZ73DRAFT_99102 [Epithele typhae]
MPPSDSVYDGTVPKLIISIDVGTSHSGVAYAFLSPGKVPQVNSVTRFPGLEGDAGNCKIPTRWQCCSPSVTPIRGARVAVGNGHTSSYELR